MNRLIATAAVLLAASLSNSAAVAQTTNQMTGLKLSGDKPIQIESDKLQVDQNKSTAVFTGNVSVVQGTTQLKAGTMTVHYTKESKDAKGSEAKQPASASPLGSGSSNIERLEADGKVYIKSDDQVATGDHGSFDMKSQVLTLSGQKVVLTQGDNVIVGCKLTVFMENGQAQLDGCGAGGTSSGGRVKMLLKPEKKK